MTDLALAVTCFLLGHWLGKAQEEAMSDKPPFIAPTTADITADGRCPKCGIVWVKMNTTTGGRCLHCLFMQGDIGPYRDWWSTPEPEPTND